MKEILSGHLLVVGSSDEEEVEEGEVSRAKAGREGEREKGREKKREGRKGGREGGRE